MADEIGTAPTPPKPAKKPNGKDPAHKPAGHVPTKPIKKPARPVRPVDPNNGKSPLIIGGPGNTSGHDPVPDIPKPSLNGNPTGDTRTPPTVDTGTPPVPPVVNPPADPVIDQQKKDARAAMQAVLDEYGLGSLGEWAWGLIQQNASNNEILQELRRRDEYKQRFAGMAGLAAKGRSISESQYIEYERSASQMMRAAGLPAGFYDQPQDFANFIGADVSLNELNSRISMVNDTMNKVPADVRTQLKDMYGVDEGALTAYFLDPDRALPLIQKQYQAAQFSSAAKTTGFGSISAQQAENLTTSGIDAQQAQSGFATLARQQELMRGGVGSTEGNIDTQTQLDAAFGQNADAQQGIERRRASRIAQFGGGGSFAQGRNGEATGLGTSR